MTIVNLKTTPEAKHLIKVEAAKAGFNMSAMTEAMVYIATKHPDFHRLTRVAMKRITDREVA